MPRDPVLRRGGDAAGLENAGRIAASSPRLRGLIFGAADYSFDIGARLAWDPLLHARARLVNSARAAGIDAVDAPSSRSPTPPG
ncbi:aldolase/citrate lyase family protein [Streptomyces stramineus]